MVRIWSTSVVIVSMVLFVMVACVSPTRSSVPAIDVASPAEDFDDSIGDVGVEDSWGSGRTSIPFATTLHDSPFDRDSATLRDADSVPAVAPVNSVRKGPQRR